MNGARGSGPTRRTATYGSGRHRSGSLTEPISVDRQNILRRVGIQRSDSESWILVYLDVVTLLLVAFVLVIAHMRDHPSARDKADQELAGLTVTTIERPRHPASEAPDHPLPQGAGLLPGGTGLLDSVQRDPLENELVRVLKAQEGLQGLEIRTQPGQVNLVLPESILFDIGKADLIGGADGVLQSVAPILLQYGVTVSVEGHTDNVPINTGQYPSNWELSSARASVVVRRLVDFGVPRGLLRAIGYADTRAVASNLHADGRQKNRRVNLVLHLNPDADNE